jgi:hypothetical protein
MAVLAPSVVQSRTWKGKRILSKRKRQSRSPSKQPKQRSKNSPSILIPVLVGVVVVVIIVGALISIENRSAAVGNVSGDQLVTTALPLATQSQPFPGVARVSIQEAHDMAQSGEALLVDVRSQASYDKAHAAGAVSFPEQEIDARRDELPRDKELILYCT